MKKCSRIAALIVSLVMLFALCGTTAGAVSYTDVPTSAYFHDVIQKAADYNLMQGYSATRFGYNDSVTRAQFVTILVRMFGWEQLRPETPSFTDIKATDTYYPYLETAVRHDVIDAGGTFRRNDPITREEMCVMLVRALGYKKLAQERQNAALPFTDVSTNKGYIAVARDIGMTNGTTATTFAPQNSATRAQAAAMLVRIYEKRYHATDWAAAFGLTDISAAIPAELDHLSLGWGKMSLDTASGTVKLLTTTRDGNDYYIPADYVSFVQKAENMGCRLHLDVYMTANVTALLSDAAYRTAAVAEIVGELTVTYNKLGRNPYSGVTIDFEGLKGKETADNFTAFLTELDAALAPLEKTLYVAVQPVLTTGAYFDGYDYRAIGEVADKVILMAYDYQASSIPANLVGSNYHENAALTPFSQVYDSLKAITDPVTGVADTSKIVLGFSTASNVGYE
ncbi:MAG: S-layer homology domain-containing protein, partial [Oscillospiraceae bacterium]|nr:S-layer homology domain-containing protein [Oscillospiraceae bacterium]